MGKRGRPLAKTSSQTQGADVYAEFTEASFTLGEALGSRRRQSGFSY